MHQISMIGKFNGIGLKHVPKLNGHQPQLLGKRLDNANKILSTYKFVLLISKSTSYPRMDEEPCQSFYW
jgi:hypothetical protein